MSNVLLDSPRNEAVELGNLLANTIAGVVSAQQKLDQYTEQRKRAYDLAEPGSLAVPPVWYLFRRVSLEMELSASVAQLAVRQETSDAERPHLVCRTLDPTMVSLYGYQASSGMRVRVDVEPQGFVPIKE